MSKEIEIYWKDLKASIKKRLLAWYKKNDFTGLEPLYNNELPFIVISKEMYEGDFGNTEAMDDMVS